MLEPILNAIRSMTPVTQQAVLYSYYMESGRRAAEYAARRDLCAAVTDYQRKAAKVADNCFAAADDARRDLRKAIKESGRNIRDMYAAARDAESMIDAATGVILINGEYIGLVF